MCVGIGSGVGILSSIELIDGSYPLVSCISNSARWAMLVFTVILDKSLLSASYVETNEVAWAPVPFMLVLPLVLGSPSSAHGCSPSEKMLILLSPSRKDERAEPETVKSSVVRLTFLIPSDGELFAASDPSVSRDST